MEIAKLIELIEGPRVDRFVRLPGLRHGVACGCWVVDGERAHPRIVLWAKA
jgi:hypothetical protein